VLMFLVRVGWVRPKCLAAAVMEPLSKIAAS